MAIDLSILNGFTGYTSSMLLASKASRAAAGKMTATGAATTGIIPTPWDPVNVKSDVDALRAAMQTTDYLNPRDSTFNKAGVPEDHKKLFTLYKALTSLQALAAKAAEKDTVTGLLPGLDRRFQSGFAEVLDYGRNLSFDHLSMLLGSKVTKTETAAAVARAPLYFQTKTVVQGDAGNPIAALENASPFTINVKRGATVQDVTIDLSEMGATPRNLGNVINHINAKLSDAGVEARLKRVDVTPAAQKGQPAPAKQYAVQIQSSGLETLSFSATTPTPSIYVAAQGVNAAELRKLDVSGDNAMTVYRTSIAGAGTDLQIKQTVRDNDGNVFVLGTTSGNLGGQINQSSSTDVMLQKYDSAGNLLWSKLMGASSKAEGLGLAVDSKGAAVVAGQITGRVGTELAAGGLDSYVMKVNANGEEAFIRQIGSALDDGATALTIGPDDAIYVGGTVKGKMTGAAGSIGGSDAYVMKLDTKGVRLWTRQFGTTGEDRVAALAIADDGALVVAAQENGAAMLRKFSTTDASSPAVWAQSLGALGTGGALTGIAVEGNKIYISGGSANGSLGGGASIVSAHSGGQDGFVAAFTDSGTGVATNFVTYLGSGAADRINGLAVADGRIYVAGDTRGQLPGGVQTRADTSNAFAAEIGADGSLGWVRQFGVTTGEGYGRGIAVATNTSSALDALGLPTGPASATALARTVTAQTSVRTGDFFEIKVGDNVKRRITIADGETMTTLARKLNSVLVLAGKASVLRTSAGERLLIEPREGQTIELIASSDKTFDALAGLGLAAGKVKKPYADATTETGELPAFAMGLKSIYSLATQSGAQSAKMAIDSALAEIRKAYREITMDPETKKMLEGDGSTAKGKTGGTVPAYLQAQLANYSAGLERLNSGSSSLSSALLT